MQIGLHIYMFKLFCIFYMLRCMHFARVIMKTLITIIFIAASTFPLIAAIIQMHVGNSLRFSLHFSSWFLSGSHFIFNDICCLLFPEICHLIHVIITHIQSSLCCFMQLFICWLYNTTSTIYFQIPYCNFQLM